MVTLISYICSTLRTVVTVDEKASETGSIPHKVPPAAATGRLSALMSGTSMPRISTSLPQLEPGRVILSVPEGWNGGLIVDYFREQFGGLSAPMELVPIVGVDNTLNLVQQAAQMGGVDFVLVHPQLLGDRSQVALRPTFIDSLPSAVKPFSCTQLV